jgi:hypothetical protein
MTPEEILAQRNAVVISARSWLDTPFFHDAAVKGKNGGCDCSHLGMCYTEALDIPIAWPKDPAHYTANPQWFCNADPATGEFREIYLDGLIANGFVEISDFQRNFEPYRAEACIDANKEPGDVAITKIGRLFAHGAVIENWPDVIQAEPNICGRGKVCRATAKANYFLNSRHMRFFSRKEWH